MTANPINHKTDGMKMSRILLAVFIAELSIVASLQAVELPPELPLWEKPPLDYAIRHDVKVPESDIAANLEWIGVAIEEPDYTIWGAAPI